LTEAKQKKLGLVYEHAYSVLSAVEVMHPQKGKIRLVKMRNPWGSEEWTGPWSDKSNLWTPELRKQLDLRPDLNDGIFHMDLNDFKQNFNTVEICMYRDVYQYTSYRVPKTGNKKHTTYFRMKVFVDGEYSVTVNQLSTRPFKSAESAKYSNVRLVIARKDPKGYVLCGAAQSNELKTFSKMLLKAGEYIVYAKVEWIEVTDPLYIKEFVLSVYGRDRVQIQEIPKQPQLVLQSYLSKARASKNLENYGDSGYPGVFKAFEVFDKEGFGYIYFRNTENRGVQSTINFSNREGLKWKKPFSGNIL